MSYPTIITDRTKMVGVLPSVGAKPIPVGKIPDEATQVASSSMGDNNTAIIHTVTALKTFYVSAITLSIRNQAAASNYGSILVRNAVDATVYTIWYCECPVDDGKLVALNLIPPLEIPEGYDICVKSNVADLIAFGFVHGYEL